MVAVTGDLHSFFAGIVDGEAVESDLGAEASLVPTGAVSSAATRPCSSTRRARSRPARRGRRRVRRPGRPLHDLRPAATTRTWAFRPSTSRAASPSASMGNTSTRPSGPSPRKARAHLGRRRGPRRALRTRRLSRGRRGRTLTNRGRLASMGLRGYGVAMNISFFRLFLALALLCGVAALSRTRPR